MANYILFVVEGLKTEKQVLDSLNGYFLQESNNTKLICAYCSDIYSLYDKTRKDSDLELFELIRENGRNKQILAGISRNSVSEIYLFFDYDGHATNADDSKLADLLDHFDEETEKGKLYISYPMVEALKHQSDNIDFKNLVITGKNKIGYKKLVNDVGHACYHFGNLQLAQWNILVYVHCKKMNFLVTGSYSFPQNISTQIEIFNKQLAKHINPSAQVAVLSAFPILLLDYYGCEELCTKIGS